MTKYEIPIESKKKKSARIPIEKLHDFNGHPYKVTDNEDMDKLVESIREQGIISPLIVRLKDNTADEYEVISGHRRLHASKRAGLTEVPALIYPYTKTEAAIAVVDSNLHRERILPSEKAFAYKMKMEALKEQGKRTDLTSSQVATKSDTATEIGKAANESRDQVFRYIRLTNLIPELLQFVDEERIALTPAVELSYLTKQEQYDLMSTIESEDCTPSLSQAQRLKKLSQAGQLNADKIFAVMSEEKANQKERISFPFEDVGVISHLQIISAKSGHILNDNHTYISHLNILKQFLKAGAVKVCSRIAVIHITAGVGKALFFCVFLQQFLLIYDRVAIVIRSVITG